MPGENPQQVVPAATQQPVQVAPQPQQRTPSRILVKIGNVISFIIGMVATFIPVAGLSNNAGGSNLAASSVFSVLYFISVGIGGYIFYKAWSDGINNKRWISPVSIIAVIIIMLAIVTYPFVKDI